MENNFQEMKKEGLWIFWQFIASSILKMQWDCLLLGNGDKKQFKSSDISMTLQRAS
jgi:hypothetical protein